MLTPGCQSKNEIIVKHLGVWLEKVFFAKIPIGTRLKKCFYSDRSIKKCVSSSFSYLYLLTIKKR